MGGNSDKNRIVIRFLNYSFMIDIVFALVLNQSLLTLKFSNRKFKIAQEKEDVIYQYFRIYLLFIMIINIMLVSLYCSTIVSD